MIFEIFKTNIWKQVPLYGDIVIDKPTLTAATAGALTGGDTERSVNKFISTLMGAFWKPYELANFCISGNPCPSKTDSVAKEKFPTNYKTALQRNILRNVLPIILHLIFIYLFAVIEYAIAQWPVIHKNEKAIVSDVDINRAISARLLSCHTKMKNLNKRQLLKASTGAVSTPESSTAGSPSASSNKNALENTPPNKTPRRRQNNKQKTRRDQNAVDDDNSAEEANLSDTGSQEDMFA